MDSEPNATHPTPDPLLAKSAREKAIYHLAEILHAIAPREDGEQDSTMTTVHIVVYVFVIGIIVLVGTVGNILSFCVLSKDKKRNSTTGLLQVLTVVDTLCLAASLFIFTIPTIHKETNWWPSLKNAEPYIELFSWPFASICFTATVWIVLLMTIDRYLVISRPLQSRAKGSARIKVATVFVCVAAVLFNIPRFWDHELVTTSDERIATEHSALRESALYKLIYMVILHSIFRSVGPLIVLSVLNFGLVRHLRKAQRAQGELGRTTIQENNVLLMLVSVVSVFVVCFLPDTLVRVVYVILNLGFGKSKTKAIMYAHFVTNALLVLNSAINCLIYCFTGQKFRKQLREVCSCSSSRCAGQ